MDLCDRQRAVEERGDACCEALLGAARIAFASKDSTARAVREQVFRWVGGRRCVYH
jgi:hypothetical protein